MPETWVGFVSPLTGKYVTFRYPSLNVARISLRHGLVGKFDVLTPDEVAEVVKTGKRPGEKKRRWEERTRTKDDE